MSRPPSTVNLLWSDVTAGRGKRLEGAGVEDPHGSHVGRTVANGLDGRGQLGIGDEDPDGTRVTQDPVDLFC